MLNDKQILRMLRKLKRFEEHLDSMIFEKVCELPVLAYQTDESLYEIPDDSLYHPVKPGDIWGGEGTYCWFKSHYTVPEEYAGRPLFLRPKMGGYEALLWVDGKPFGTFATKIVVTGHGNHYCDMLVKNPQAGQDIKIDVEFYSGHYVMGCMPFEEAEHNNYRFPFSEMDICVKNEKIADFYFNLRALSELVEVLDDTSYRKAELINVMLQLHQVLYYDPSCVSKEEFYASLEKGQEIMAPALARHNSSTAPSVGVIGHSHMDTAWLWHIGETIKKCARTYSNQLNLMEQYPEYTFIQSSAYHAEVIRQHYPELFSRIQQRALEGRYEPNGGVWVECDCNITSGESMIRQFLWGQRFTRKYFNFTSDAFWLPDTFGYSAAIPQIMQGCGVKYFLTTKMAWNDTNQFPYDTFYWKGIDGTRVFSHLNKTHVWPAPKDFYQYVYGTASPDAIRQKYVADRKLISYGFGDGGGGPQYEMVEMARRCHDLEGCPKAEHTTVSHFMQELEANVHNPDTYSGELYLELHRGTLTNQHNIKRHNRLAEIALHNLEYLTVYNAVEKGAEAGDSQYRDLQETLLVNQFHDILPGTCIPRAHQESLKATGELLEKSASLISEAAGVNGDKTSVTVVNPTSFARHEVIYLDYVPGMRVQGDYAQQVVDTLRGGKKLAVDGVEIPPYSSVVLTLEAGELPQGSAFTRDGDSLETPFAKIRFTENGYMSSFWDIAAERELKGEGYALNTFLVAEDVPAEWDNWDVDADMEMKFRDCAHLISSETVCDGPVELRIRNRYQLTEKSTITQDMIFSASSPIVRFETLMDWQDDHRFLKTAFDTSIFSDFVRQEIQFGYLKRPTTRNNSEDKAKFEVLNHKYTDISETRFGAAILNDCKYGISVYGGQLRLSLHKGGLRPDFNGDKGEHYCEYAFLPHCGGFSAETVIEPAYALNYKPLVFAGARPMNSLISSGAPNVVIETLKPCEDGGRAFIARVYEAEGAYTHGELQLGFEPSAVYETNMLEEPQQELTADSSLRLTFRPFEIKTLKICY